MGGVVDLLDGLLLMSLRTGYGMAYMTPLETYYGFPVHLVHGVGCLCMSLQPRWCLVCFISACHVLPSGISHLDSRDKRIPCV